MKKSIVALTVLMALSATAQADMFESKNELIIKGNVTVDGCAFKDDNIDGQILTMTLPEKSLTEILANPDEVAGRLDANDQTTLVCPPSITTVDLALVPVANTVEGTTILKNTSADADAAKGIGFKLAVALGEALSDTPQWVDFSSHAFSAEPATDTGEVAINFGGNYALTGLTSDVTAGPVEAKVPFTISYM
ncbi:fimbrial protein [Aeromonas veronii]|uniref:fimbrial protein n=1 Tax=Aeromonas veronii TaxID=654 RepID=UPI0027147152|nr:hypothetical protein [Aeromonas veronii]WLD19799.1 hypothetical protein O1Q77_16750 [Aeromonas veronii]